MKDITSFPYIRHRSYASQRNFFLKLFAYVSTCSGGDVGECSTGLRLCKQID